MIKSALNAAKCLFEKLIDGTNPQADSIVFGLVLLSSGMLLAAVGVLLGQFFGKTIVFDFQGYGIGGGSLLGGSGAGVGARALMTGKGRSTLPPPPFEGGT